MEEDKEPKQGRIILKKTFIVIILSITIALAYVGVLVVVANYDDFDFNANEIPVGLMDEPIEVVDKNKELKEEIQRTIDILEKPDPMRIIPFEPEFDNTFTRSTEIDPNLKTTVLEIPDNVLDMVLFIKENPTLTNEQVDLLLSYAVGKERGLVDEKIDLQVQELMVNFLEEK